MHIIYVHSIMDTCIDELRSDRAESFARIRAYNRRTFGHRDWGWSDYDDEDFDEEPQETFMMNKQVDENNCFRLYEIAASEDHGCEKICACGRPLISQYILANRRRLE